MASCVFPVSLSSLSTPKSLPSYSFASTNAIASPVSSANSSTEQKKPRKNRSAYTLFSLDVKPKLKASSNFKMSCVDLQTTISQLWKNLSSEERKKYQDQANEEKLHYMLKLKKFYENATPETIEEATKPKPKRPYSAYCYFVKEIRQVINLPDTKYKMQEILKQASEKWRLLSEEEKAVYQRKAREAKEAYNAETTDCSEGSESVKIEIEEPEKPVKEQKKSKKDSKAGSSLNKKRGIHFPKEIQDKMEMIEQQTPLKKLKTDPIADLRAQLGVSQLPTRYQSEASEKMPLVFSEKMLQVKQETREEEPRGGFRRPAESVQLPLFSQLQAGALANSTPFAQPWLMNTPSITPPLNVNLMMGYEQMRRLMVNQIFLNNMTMANQKNLFAMDVKTESH